MSLACAVCGTDRITVTVETDDGLKALCDVCYPPVAEQARKVADSAAAEHRFHSRQLWEPR